MPTVPGAMRPPGNIVGKQVARLRNAQGISQEDLAAKCQRVGFDLSRDVLARIETGLRFVTDAELVFLAHALTAQVSDLLPPKVAEAFIAESKKGRTYMKPGKRPKIARKVRAPHP